MMFIEAIHTNDCNKYARVIMSSKLRIIQSINYHKIIEISYKCKCGLTGFYPSMVFVVLVYNSGNQNVLINE